MFRIRFVQAATLAISVSLAPQSYGQPGPSAAAAESTGFSIRNARVAVKDPVVTARFYEMAFGLKEVLRIESPRRLVILSFGATTEEAKQNTGARILLDEASPGWSPDDLAHIILNVPDTYLAVERVRKAGGRVVREPLATVRPDMTRVVAYVQDPDGNLLELLAEQR